MVPPVPAPATNTSTFKEDRWPGVEGVETTASMISGPVVYSCARGLLTYAILNPVQVNQNSKASYVTVLIQDDSMRNFFLEFLRYTWSR